MSRKLVSGLFSNPSKYVAQVGVGKSKKPMAHRHERRKIRASLRLSSYDSDE